MAVICDGIGGLSKGEEASSYVVRQLTNWFMSEGYHLSIKKQEKRMIFLTLLPANRQIADGFSGKK